jgi:pimeloyl-ACP methyl ester carboxylesterase
MSDLPPTANVLSEAPSLTGEGCPPPLVWHEVVEAFRAGRDEFVLPTSWGEVQLWEFGEGAPLLFLGGPAGNADLFALTAWLLRSERRSLFLTLPDAPRTVPPASRLAGWGDLVAQTLSARGVGPLPIYAAGPAGWIALQFALDAPTQVSHLILQGTVPAIAWTFSERILLAVGQRLPGRLGRVPLWRRIVEANHRPWFPPFDVTRWEFLRSNLAATPIQRYVQQVWNSPPAASTERLRELRVPVLLVRTEGEGTRITAGQQALVSLLKDVRVEWMHSAGHFPYLTHPHRLVKLVREFLTSPSQPLRRAEAAPA